MSRRVLVLALSLAAIAGAASGQPLPPPQPTDPAPPLGLGEDGDSRPPSEQVFISPAGEPFRAPLEAGYPVAAWFARADADRDGALTIAEFTADALAFHDRLDSDRDGRVDGFENGDYERDVAPEISRVMRRPPRPSTPAGAGGLGDMPSRGDMIWGRMPMVRRGPSGDAVAPPRRTGAGQYGLLNEPHPVRGADADLDGKISRAEATAAARRRFGLLDQDGDGRLPLADLPKTPAQLLFSAPEPQPRRKP